MPSREGQSFPGRTLSVADVFGAPRSPPARWTRTTYCPGTLVFQRAWAIPRLSGLDPRDRAAVHTELDLGQHCRFPSDVRSARKTTVCPITASSGERLSRVMRTPVACLSSSGFGEARVSETGALATAGVGLADAAAVDAPGAAVAVDGPGAGATDGEGAAGEPEPAVGAGAFVDGDSRSATPPESPSFRGAFVSSSIEK